MSLRRLIFVILLIPGSIGCVSSQTRAAFRAHSSLIQHQLHSRVSSNLNPTQLREVGDCFAIDGHSVQEGDGLVLAFYRDRSRRWTADTDSFEYLTIYLPGVIMDGHRSLPEEGIAFYSSGTPSFPSRSGCLGYATGGQLELYDVRGSTIRASLDLQFQTISPRGIKNVCGPLTFHQELRFRRIEKWSNRSCLGSPD